MRESAFSKMRKSQKRGPVHESASPEMRKLACPRRLVGAVLERARSGLGAGSEHVRITFGAGPIGTATQRFRKV